MRRLALPLLLLSAGCFPERPELSLFGELCDNAADDDADDLVDCADPDCAAACNGVAGLIESDCRDGVDDDDDGLEDCEDPDCASQCDDVERDCQDGIDDDGDGAIDCADDDCGGESGC